jgi:hypothetical protein
MLSATGLSCVNELAPERDLMIQGAPIIVHVERHGLEQRQ